MRVLALDLGTKTLGLAISDETMTLSSPLTTLRYDNEDYDYLLDELDKIIKKYNVDVLVLGLPKNMDNSLGFASERSLNFKKLIEDNINIEVILQDERLSSVEANNLMIMGDTSRKNRKEKVDSLAATIILQRYLDQRKD